MGKILDFCVGGFVMIWDTIQAVALVGAGYLTGVLIQRFWRRSRRDDR